MVRYMELFFSIGCMIVDMPNSSWLTNKNIYWVKRQLTYRTAGRENLSFSYRILCEGFNGII